MPFTQNVKHLSRKTTLAQRREAKQFTAYLVDATKNFCDLNRHDYSTLPAELLQEIMNYVSEPEVDTTKISTHLFKSRLVCKSFSVAALAVFLSLTRSGADGVSLDYTTLNLPPKHGDLTRLMKAMKNTKISRLITKVIYHVISAPDTSPDEDALVETCANWMGELECSCEDFGDCRWCDPERLIDKNVDALSEQSRRQRRFAHSISSGKGVERFAKLFTVLENLVILRVEVHDFWDISSIYEGHDAHPLKFIDTTVWWKALPTLMEQLTGPSKIKELQLHRLGSASFEEMHPQTILTLDTQLGLDAEFD